MSTRKGNETNIGAQFETLSRMINEEEQKLIDFLKETGRSGVILDSNDNIVGEYESELKGEEDKDEGHVKTYEIKMEGKTVGTREIVNEGEEQTFNPAPGVDTYRTDDLLAEIKQQVD